MILQNLTRNYEILRKFTKVNESYNIPQYFLSPITFVPFHSIAMYYWHFKISYHDKQNFSVCYCTILPLGDIVKYFAIVKQKVIFPISKILNQYMFCIFVCTDYISLDMFSSVQC
jgi:hypothetical protein